MSFIGEAYRESHGVMSVCLTIDDCLQFLPLVKKEVAKAEKKRDYYQDILESGEASTRQTNALDRAESKLKALESIQETMTKYIQEYASSYNRWQG